MELLAAIKGLEALRDPCIVDIYSDSEYLVKGIEDGWALKWKANGWRKRDKTKALNVDLWARLLQLCEMHQVSFTWVRGHSGHLENERCDRLAAQAAEGNNLTRDEFYENGSVGGGISGQKTIFSSSKELKARK